MGAIVVTVPESCIRQWRVIGAGMHGDVSGAHDSPAAFCFHLAEAGAHARHGVGHAAGMRYGVKTIGCHHRPDTDGLEQDIESRMTRHLTDPTGSRGPSIGSLRSAAPLFIDRSITDQVFSQESSR